MNILSKKPLSGASMVLALGLVSVSAPALATSTTTYKSVTFLKAAWIASGAECSHPKAAIVASFNGGRMVECTEQDSMPIWFASKTLADKFSKANAGTGCIRGVNWAVYQFAYPFQAKKMKIKLKADYCK
jgi:hypothetical protein